MVDRGRPKLGVERRVLRVDALERRRLVLLEQVALERAREQVVVHPEEHVALGVPRGEERPGQHLARVPGLQDAQPGLLLLERPLHVVRDRERVVRDEDDLGRRFVAAAAGGSEQRRTETRSGRSLVRLFPAGADRGTTPRSTDTVALSSVSIGHAAARAGLERLAAKLVGEALGPHTLRRAVQREQRDQLAGLALDRALAAHDVDPRAADRGVDAGSGEAGRRARAAGGGGRAGRRCSRERGSGRARMPVPPPARARGRWRPSRRDGGRCGRRPSAAATASGAAESKSPTATATSRPRARACSRPPSTATTAASSGTDNALGARRRPACDHHHDFVRHAFLRWHYPDRVLRVGGALEAALSARLPRAPRYVNLSLPPWSSCSPSPVPRRACARVPAGEPSTAGSRGSRALRRRCRCRWPRRS